MKRKILINFAENNKLELVTNSTYKDEECTMFFMYQNLESLNKEEQKSYLHQIDNWLKFQSNRLNIKL